MVITSELGGCALQPAAALASLPLGLVTSEGYNPELRVNILQVTTIECQLYKEKGEILY